MAYMFNEDKSKCRIKSNSVTNIDKPDIAPGEKKKLTISTYYNGKVEVIGVIRVGTDMNNLPITGYDIYTYSENDKTRVEVNVFVINNTEQILRSVGLSCGYKYIQY